ncbi:uncharacterized protein LOC144168189 [Haemaphysalis longicornis]
MELSDYAQSLPDVTRQRYIEKLQVAGEQYPDPKKWQFFAASPDGLVECSCCGRGVLEIKCPCKHRNALERYF